ncbi:MAG: hypothetical protein ACOX0F_04575 [Syntrophomonadaceae bacterium]
MLGYMAGITLVLFLILAAIFFIRVFSGKSAQAWGKASAFMAVLFTVAFILWISIEIPAFERQQAKILLQMGQDYMAEGDLAMAYDSYAKISKADKAAYEMVQPILGDLRGPLAAARLEEAKALYAEQRYADALDALKISINYAQTDESKQLLPAYQKAAGKK